MNLSAAEKIVEVALAVGGKNGLNPLTVAVLDGGGHLVCFKKQDGAALFRQEIATGKALGALGMGMDSAKLLEMANKRPAFMTAAYAASQGRIIPVAGGVLVKNGTGKVIGSVGISGDLSEKDEACAIEGIRAAGFSCEAIELKKPSILKAKL